MSSRRYLKIVLGVAAAATLACGATSARSVELKLDVNDAIAIRALEWPELTGEFVIGSTGQLSLPLVGSVPAAGFAPEELERLLSERLQGRSRLPDRVSVTVQVTRYRPVYVLGDVQSPGEFPFRPNLSVIQAISMAGGFYRLTDPGLLRLERDAISSGGDEAVLARRLHELVARQMRLKAELQDATTVTFPAPTDGQEADRDQLGIEENERLILAVRVRTLAEKLSGFQRAIALYGEEIKSLQLQIEASNQQLLAVERELEEVRGFVARGLAPTPRLTLLERTVGQLKAERQLLETSIIRARQNINVSEQSSLTLVSERRQEVLAELQSTRIEEHETRRRLETARKLVIEAEQVSPATISGRLTTRGRNKTFTITRRRGNVSEVLSATANTVLAPGDVIQVYPELSPRAETLGRATGASHDGALARR